jgi:hypothetical protein
MLSMSPPEFIALYADEASAERDMSKKELVGIARNPTKIPEVGSCSAVVIHAERPFPSLLPPGDASPPWYSLITAVLPSGIVTE